MKLNFEETAQTEDGLWLTHNGESKYFIPLDKISALIPISVEDDDNEDQYRVETHVLLSEKVNGIELVRISNATPTAVFQTLVDESKFFEILTSVKDDPDDVGSAFIHNGGVVAIRYNERNEIGCVSVIDVYMDEIYGEGLGTHELDLNQTPQNTIKHIEHLFEGTDRRDGNWKIKPRLS